MKRLSLFLVSGLAAALMLVPSVALGFSAKSGDNVTVAKGETYHGSLFAAGKSVTVDGDVDGDLWCAGSTININGTVHGDVLCAGQTVTINGSVDGNIRVAGQTVTANGPVSRNISVASQAFTLGSAGKVTGDLGFLGQSATVNGAVERDLYGAGANLTLAAPVAGSATLQVDDLNVSSGGHVGGNLDYTSAKTADVGSGKVGGKVTRHDPPKHEQPSPRSTFLGWLAGVVYWILAMLVIALPLVWLAPRLVRKVTNVMAGRAGASIGLGVVVMFVAPLASLALLFTIIGIPLAFLVFGMWLLTLFVSGIFAGIATGRWILARSDWQRDSLMWAAVVGVPVAMLVFAIPVLGILATLVGTWWALGAFVVSLSEVKA